MRWARLSPAIASGGGSASAVWAALRGWRLELRGPTYLALESICRVWWGWVVGVPGHGRRWALNAEVLLGGCAGLARPCAKGPALGQGHLGLGKPTRA